MPPSTRRAVPCGDGGRPLRPELVPRHRPQLHLSLLSMRSGGHRRKVNVKSMNVVVVAIALLLASPSVSTVRAQSGYEQEPVLQAKDLVAAELLKGPHYTVDSRVPVKGFLARFTIRSDYGTFDAHGIFMFQVRVREIYALTQLDQ